MIAFILTLLGKHNQMPDLLTRSRQLLESPQLISSPQHPAQITWVSSTTVLFCSPYEDFVPADEPGSYHFATRIDWAALDVKSHKVSRLGALSDFAMKEGYLGAPLPSPDGKWLLWTRMFDVDQQWPPHPIWTLSSFNGRVVRQWPRHAMGEVLGAEDVSQSYAVWSRDGRSIIEWELDYRPYPGQVHTWRRPIDHPEREEPLATISVPHHYWNEAPVADLGGGRLMWVPSRNDFPVTDQPAADIATWKLASGSNIHFINAPAIPGVSFAVDISHTDGEIIWEARDPISHLESLWVSESDGGKPIQLGSVELKNPNDDLSGISWIPNSRSVAFVFGGRLYALDLASRKPTKGSLHSQGVPAAGLSALIRQ